MKVAIDGWDPEYGGGVEPGGLAESEVPVDVDVEVPLDRWAPMAPPAGAPWPSVVFVDGVRRVEARAWITDDAGTTRQGLCASFAAGAVRSNGAASVLAPTVRRVLVAGGEGAASLPTRHGTFDLVVATSDEPDRLSLVLQGAMGGLEVDVARLVAAGTEPVVVDGPLREHRHLPGAIGYVKVMHRSYGPPVVLEVASRLAPGERTPLFVVGERFTRWSWYLRLPTPITHPLAGIVRCEAPSSLDLAGAVAAADGAARSLPRYASTAHKDSRAPQNLFPIAGLERALRHRLGDPVVVRRALRAAATSAPAA